MESSLPPPSLPPAMFIAIATNSSFQFGSRIRIVLDFGPFGPYFLAAAVLLCNSVSQPASLACGSDGNSLCLSDAKVLRTATANSSDIDLKDASSLWRGSDV